MPPASQDTLGNKARKLHISTPNTPVQTRSHPQHACGTSVTGGAARGAGKQDSAKPPVSQLTLGDRRVRAFQTSYAAEFAPPLPSGACLRSPLRNQGLAEATTDLRAVYRSAFQRTGECVAPSP